MRACPDCGLSYQDPKNAAERNAPFICTACLSKATPRPPEGWPIEAKWANGTIGRGVFLTRDVVKGEVLERCWVMPIPAEEAKLTIGIPTINRYLFPWTDGQRAMISGEGLLYNYDSVAATGKAPNSECVLRRGISAIEFRALRNIRAGDEIRWDYKKATVRRI